VTGLLRGWVLAVGVGAAGVGAVMLGSSDRAAVSLYDLVRCVILGGIGGCGAVLFCYTVAWHVWPAMRSRPDALQPVHIETSEPGALRPVHAETSEAGVRDRGGARSSDIGL
jgi:hypothetical protein